MRRVFGILAALSMSVGAAAAQALQHVVSVDGTCQRLVIEDIALSGNCGAAVLQTIYDDGRTGFYITAADGSQVFAFSGFEQSSPGQTEVTQTLDKVILSGEPATSIPVTGSCTYGNPYAGPMTILCDAQDTSRQRYQFEFVTDGSEPEILQ